MAEDTSQDTQGADHHEAKRSLLQHLIGAVLKAPSNGIKDVIGGVKNALAAYKSFASEWDTLRGSEQPKQAGGAAGEQRGLLKEMVHKQKPSGFGAQDSFAPTPNPTPAMPAAGPGNMTPPPSAPYNPSGGNNFQQMQQQYPHGFSTPGSQTSVTPLPPPSQQQPASSPV